MPATRPHTHAHLLAYALHETIPGLDAQATAALDHIPGTDPNRLADELRMILDTRCPHAVVLGTQPHRLAAFGHADQWTFVDLTGIPLERRVWPEWAAETIDLHEPDSWLSPATATPDAVRRLTRPRILLVALYHPEHFPLPRFPLGISDLARAARKTLSGRVDLLDMQLGATLDDVVTAVADRHPDVLGISATFGQHDLLTQLLDIIEGDEQRPRLVLAGGSLTVRNERRLLDRYPWLLVARGAGEPTIADAIAHWHGDIPLEAVRGVGYRRHGHGPRTRPVRRTAVPGNRQRIDIYPELDLLPATLAAHGVAQLETSRGCTHHCSFCPRNHKGSWAGAAPADLPQILAALADVFDAFPDTSRTLFLVDEEFIGRDADAATRAHTVAGLVHQAGFRWETSCRVDQVVLPAADHAWHVERAQLWRDLLDQGLRRCLFGVESGVAPAPRTRTVGQRQRVEPHQRRRPLRHQRRMWSRNTSYDEGAASVARNFVRNRPIFRSKIAGSIAATSSYPTHT